MLVQETQARTDYLNLLHTLEPGSRFFDEWCAVRLDRLVVDLMLRQGSFGSAQTFAGLQGITSLVDLPVFEQIRRVELSLVPEEGSTILPSCGTALAWCSENKMALRKAKSSLEFELRLQEFVEQVRDRTMPSLQRAAQYARKYLLPWLQNNESADDSPGPKSNVTTGSPTYASPASTMEHLNTRQQVSRAMGLLALGPDSWCYRDLYDPCRWKTLRDSFRSIALQVYDLPAAPLIHIALSAGLSSIKTQSCFTDKAHEQEPEEVPKDNYQNSSQRLADSVEMNLASPADDRHPDCPICQTEGLGTLAPEVPFSHQGNSRIICRITGKVMDDKNPPMCLPNGRVYSEEVRCRLHVV